MAIDLNTLSARELDSLINQAKKRKTTLKKRKSAAVVRRKIEALARTEGYTVAELFGSAGTGRVRKAAAPAKTARKLGKVPPKYRNPANKAETWTGRGKHPRWLAAELAKGKKIEDFLIKA
ncbi:H-NS family nucleoid-associated regulatory protein [Luteimonas huabeiensis]|uniref:H-NS histone family protein n=1 Tax=Luteimonas huabeiensis TaxID=1244513 RepID=UPI0004633FCB|nr:H-NS histone family protein [Luteimonas huabeiensis]